MKKLLACFVISSNLLWAAPTFVGGTGVQCTSNTTCSISYSPTSGNTVAVCVATANTITSPGVVDNAGSPVSLTAGAQTIGSAPPSAMFYYTAGSGITQFTASWTTSRASSIVVVEYSGVASVVGNPTGSTFNGNGVAISVSPVAIQSGDVALGCLVRNAGTAQTITAGTQRAEAHTASVSAYVVDAVATGATATTVSSTTTTGPISASAIILRTAAGAGPPANQYPRAQ